MPGLRHPPLSHFTWALMTLITAVSARVVVSPTSRPSATSAQEAAHDLARPGLRDFADDVDVARAGDRSDLFADPLAQLVAEPVDGVLLQITALDDDEGDHRLTRGLVARADHSASATPSCPTRADSISAVESRWPETFMTSSTLPSSQTSPSSSRRAPSPAK